MASIKQKWFELGKLDNEQQVEYLKDTIELYKKSPSSYGLLYAALYLLTLIFLPMGYYIVFGGVFWVTLALGVHFLVYAAKLRRFKKTWGFK